jgi:hypothetical protein
MIKTGLVEKEKASIRRLEIENYVYHKYQTHEAAQKNGHWNTFSRWVSDNDKSIKHRLELLEEKCDKNVNKVVPSINESIKLNVENIQKNNKRISESLNVGRENTRNVTKIEDSIKELKLKLEKDQEDLDAHENILTKIRKTDKLLQSKLNDRLMQLKIRIHDLYYQVNAESEESELTTTNLLDRKALGISSDENEMLRVKKKRARFESEESIDLS